MGCYHVYTSYPLGCSMLKCGIPRKSVTSLIEASTPCIGKKNFFEGEGGLKQSTI
jgi:hypothetical protein